MSSLCLSSSSPMATIEVMQQVEQFYLEHVEIKASHGIRHILAVHTHAVQAIACHDPPLEPHIAMEIEVAALLHDVDDSKYFPKHRDFENARSILQAVKGIDQASQSNILFMIGLVSCSKNGNTVPSSILTSGEYSRLIPRWADRLEAVGAIGVVRCFQYTIEHGQPLSSAASPRAVTEEDVWTLATLERFQQYISSGGQSDDMVSHYYDKLLHVSRPPREIVRNSYLEEKAIESSKDLVEMCIRFGKTGAVDVDFVRSVAKGIGIDIR